MPYSDGNPTLGEQLDEDARRRFYTRELLDDAREMQAEIKALRAALLDIASHDLIGLSSSPARLVAETMQDTAKKVLAVERFS